MRVIVAAALVCTAGAILRAADAQAGGEVDIAAFAHSGIWEGHPGIEWEEPRIVRRAEIGFAERALPERAHLEYWVSNWPPVDRGGWTKTDTPWQGEWREVRASRSVEDKKLVFRFEPLTEAENENAKNVPDYAPAIRKTLKLRIRVDGTAATIAAFHAYGESRWTTRDIDVESGGEGKPPVELSVTAYNGRILETRPLAAGRRGVRVSVQYTEHTPESPDRTILTVRAGKDAFGVSVDDVLTRHEVYIRPFGIFVGDVAAGATFRSFFESGRFRPGQNIAGRVANQPEQTLNRALGQVPALAMTHRSGRHPLRYYPLGFPASREKYGLDYNGNLFISKVGSKAMKEDLAGMLWDGDEIYFRIGAGAPPDFREREHAAHQELLDGWLPQVTTRWRTGGIEYEEQAYATLVDAPLEDERLRGDEPTIALLRIEARNPAATPASARVSFVVSPSEEFRLENGFLIAIGNRSGRYQNQRLRATLEPAAGSLELRAAGAESGPAAVWSVDLPAGGASTLAIKIPFRTFQAAADLSRIQKMTYGARLDETVGYWRKLADLGMRLRVPDSEFNRFYLAVLQHIMISIEKDVNTGYDMCPCGTYDYNMFANETALQVRLLEMRGLHGWAWRCLRPLVELQGSKTMPGMFTDTAAAFHGVRVDAEHDYTHGNYNLNHGWVMWTAAEHYFYTRDREWLKSVAPRLERAADWIVRERQATMRHSAGGVAMPEYGLLPAGDLEDNEDFEYWFAVNAYAYRGLRAAAEALSAVDSGTGARLAMEAAAYRDDIRRAAFTAMAAAPAVPLRDGTFVPSIPPRTSLHGRDIGWIRNILYGALTLVDCGVLSAEEPATTWILQDYEDNLFMAEDSMSVPDRDWFSRGGVTLQPNLVNTALAYFDRDELSQALRVFYNTFAVSYYPDIAAFTEWVPTLGTGGGPFFKTSDEAAFLAWLRMLLVRERGEALCLNCGAPREWLRTGAITEIADAATYLGKIGYRIESHTGAGYIEASVDVPADTRATRIDFRLRHPDGKIWKRVELDGKSWDRVDAAHGMITLPPGGGHRQLRIDY